MVKVYDLERTQFVCNTDEIVFFGTNDQTQYAFGTVDFLQVDLPVITSAINWYAESQLNCPDLVISIKDPRPQVKLRLVK